MSDLIPFNLSNAALILVSRKRLKTCLTPSMSSSSSSSDSDGYDGIENHMLTHEYAIKLTSLSSFLA